MYLALCVIGLTLGRKAYPSLCPDNSNKCFNIVASQWSIFIFCVGLLFMYAHKFLTRSEWGKVNTRQLQLIRAIGLGFWCAAAGWFLGTASYI